MTLLERISDRMGTAPNQTRQRLPGPNPESMRLDWRAAMQSTEWRPVDGHEGFYEVSSDGHVRNIMTGHELHPSTTNSGRGAALTVELSQMGKRERRSLHKVVAEAFLGPKTAPLIRHLDGDHTNNHVSNLAWGTQSENQLDSVRHGTHRNARKTHCDAGHELAGENLLPDTLGRRICRRCKVISKSEYLGVLISGGGAHATTRAYSVGCRCAECKEFYAGYQKAARARRKNS